MSPDAPPSIVSSPPRPGQEICRAVSGQGVGEGGANKIFKPCERVFLRAERVLHRGDGEAYRDACGGMSIRSGIAACRVRSTGKQIVSRTALDDIVDPIPGQLVIEARADEVFDCRQRVDTNPNCILRRGRGEIND